MNISNFLIFILISLINNTSETGKSFFKCGKNDLKLKPKPSNNRISIDQSNINYKRKLDSDGFKNFNIYLDLVNIEKGIQRYKLTQYKNLFITSFRNAINTLQSLLKVKPLKYSYYMTDENIMEMGVYYWDTSKFGTSAAKKGISTGSLGIDLLIFGRFVSNEQLGDGVLASAGAYYIEKETNQPTIGLVNINKDLDYSIINSQEYFQSIILHEFTHILGFDYDFFKTVFNNVLIQKDKFGIERYYINSTKVVNVAKKYFNCENVIGVELENYGDTGTAGSHWEARLLLGDYMNGIIYEEEQVISEFTLALLEDTGYYKANYYTGGLMRYGKNKGCEFLNEKCVNDFEINSNFENEFFDWYNQISLYTPSCSSGRQSRTYNIIWKYKKMIPEEYQYFNNSYLGGSSSADYCPVATFSLKEQEFGYYIGHCSNKGSGLYGSQIFYNDNTTNETYYFLSEDIETMTEEEYSENSFCYLSSLFKKNKNVNDLLINNTRAICFETFCSNKSLTIKIGEDFIVCPRAGGKIEVNGYDGYLLCPDYNLICSGTILCNDMFDCVEKKSEIKEESYIYDYEIKTSQNLAKAEYEEPDNINNYELSINGMCPQYCKLCNKNQKCLECKDGYKFVGKLNEEKIECVDSAELENGYYKINDSIYYKCIDNCDKCVDSISCETCKSNFLHLFNKCIKKIDNCKEYIEDGSCKICNDNYAFIESNRNECISLDLLDEYYSKDNGISFFKCDGEGDNHIENCTLCHYNETLICDNCIDDNYILQFNKCIKKIDNCIRYDETKNCNQCNNTFGFIGNDRTRCIDVKNLDNYFYSKDDGISFYSCGDIENCIKCHYNGQLECTECKVNYNLDTNKKICSNSKYILINLFFLILVAIFYW